MEALIKENNAIDIYEDYFAGAVADHSSEQPYARTLTVFRDPSAVKRSASYISWCPDGAPACLLRPGPAADPPVCAQPVGPARLRSPTASSTSSSSRRGCRAAATCGM